MNILDLFAHIGLKADQGPADNFLKSINGIKGGLVGAIAGTLSMAAAVKAVNASFADTLALKKFEADTGQSSAAMQKWTAIANQVNGSGATVAETLRSITTNQEKIKLGTGNISGYQLLGIDPRADPIEVLEQFRAKTQNVSASMRRNLATQLGISNDLVSTLELSNTEFDKMAANAWVVPSSSIASINKARASMETLKNMIVFVRTELVAKFAPAITKVVDMMTRAARMIDTIVKGSVGWKNVIIGLTAAFAVMNAGFLLSPIGLFTAGIVLLMLALEDLYVYTQGGESLFGDMMNSFPALKKVLDDTFGVFKDLATAISAIFGNDDAMNTAIEKWGAWGKVVQGVSEYLKLVRDYWEWIANKISGKFKSDAEMLSNIKIPDWMVGMFGDAKDATGGILAGGITGGVGALRSAGGSVTNTISNFFNIDGSGDPNATGAAVGKAVDKVMADTYNPNIAGKREAQ